MTSSFTPEMVALSDQIEHCNQKLTAINSDSCQELTNEINKLNHQKLRQLQLLKEQKNCDLQLANDRHKQQITKLNQEKDEQISDFKKYCVKYLKKMKKDIKKSNRNIDTNIDFSEIYKEWNDKKEMKRIRYTRSNAKTNKIFPPQTSLNRAEIQNDLIYLINKAKEQNIELSSDDTLNTDFTIKKQKIKIKKAKKMKYKTGISVSETEKMEIENICDKIGIEMPEKALRVALYGYNTHIEVYSDIYEWIHKCDTRQQRDIISALRSGKLRDIKVKIGSHGTVGRKIEMANGIKKKMKELTKKYNHHRVK